MRKFIVILALTAAAALTLAACGGSSSSSSSTSSSGGGGGGAAAGGGGGATAAGGSTVKISADPSGQLAYQETSLSAKAGNVSVDFTNQAPLQHDFCISQGSKDLGCTSVIQGASTSKTFNNLKGGNYTFFCSVDGHEAAGMKGTLTVK